jgi:ribokinase
VGRVVVVGSINLDRTLFCSRLPGPGETVLGHAGDERFGGKGGNQACAAAALGAPTFVVGAVGVDAHGAAACRDLAARGVDVSHVQELAGEVTGQAVVLVDPAGENSIVVLPGANGRLTRSWVQDSLDSIAVRAGDVVMTSGEIDDDCAAAAAQTCREVGAVAVHNLAPFTGFRPWLAETRPILILNEIESIQATGSRDIGTALERLGELAAAIVITRGPAGATLFDGLDRYDAPGHPAIVVDTTGAGDAFCGAFAAEIAAGARLKQALESAVIAGAVAVTGAGARGALARPSDLERQAQQ